MEKTKKVDFHIHSDFSDGVKSIEEIFIMANKGNIKIALTDHDTNEHWVEAKIQGDKRKKVQYILGTEFSAMHYGKEIHILGYSYDQNNEKIQKILSDYKESNVNWLINMAINFAAKTGKSFDFSKIDLKGMPEKVRLTKYLIENDLIPVSCNESLSNIVEKTFKHKGKYHIQRRIKRVTAAEIINNIKEANGVAVIAHPLKSGLKKEDLDFFTNKIGIDGIEVFSQRHSQNSEELLEYTRNKGIYAFGGSDFHGNGYIGCENLIETVEKMFT